MDTLDFDEHPTGSQATRGHRRDLAAMYGDEASDAGSARQASSALQLGPRKRPYVSLTLIG
jgi:hypothetical protein